MPACSRCQLLAFIATVGLLCLDAGRAEASCGLASECLCRYGTRGSAVVYEATVTRVDAETVTYTVTATHGTPPDGGAPETVTLEAQGWERVGQSHLVFPERLHRTLIYRGDVIECSNLRIPLAQAIDIALAEDCYQRLVALGFVEPECHDVGHVCAVGSGSPWSVLWVAALLLAIRRRRPTATSGTRPDRRAAPR